MKQNWIFYLGWYPHPTARTMLLEMNLIQGPKINARLLSHRPEFFSPHHTELIRPVLLGRGQLGHGRNEDVAQIGLRPALRGERGEAPGTALVIHQAARAIDRVEDAFEAGLLHRRAARKSDGRTLQSLHHQLDRPALRPAFFKPGQHGVFADLVDAVNRVRSGDRRHAGHPPGVAPLRRPHGIANGVLQPAKEPAGPVEVGMHH